MPRPTREDEPGTWFHVTNRGIARRPAFPDRASARQFLAELARAHRSGRLEVHAYSVLANHFHLLQRGSRPGRSRAPIGISSGPKGGSSAWDAKSSFEPCDETVEPSFRIWALFAEAARRCSAFWDRARYPRRVVARRREFGSGASQQLAAGRKMSWERGIQACGRVTVIGVR